MSVRNAVKTSGNYTVRCRERQEDLVEILLPKLLPLPAKTSPKQRESGGNNVDHVIET